MNHNFKNIVGQKFARLLVIALLPYRLNNGSAVWLCICDCGNTSKVTGKSLRYGTTKSCGCYNKEQTAKAKMGISPSTTLPKGEGAFRERFGAYKLDAKKRGYTFDLEREEVRAIMTSPCYYCGIKSSMSYGRSKSNGKFICNGMDRVDNNKGYVKGNVVPCCFQCNKAKWTLGLDEFKDFINRVYKHLNFKQDEEAFVKYASC